MIRLEGGEKREKKSEKAKHLHEIIISHAVVVLCLLVRSRVLRKTQSASATTRHVQASFCLRGLALLASLLCCLLLLQLLIGGRRKRRSNLLNIRRREFLDQRLTEIRRPESVLWLLALRRQKRHQRLCERLELQLRSRLEKGQIAQVDSRGRIRAVSDGYNCRLGGCATRLIRVQIQITEQILRVLEVRLLLLPAQSRALLGGIFLCCGGLSGGLLGGLFGAGFLLLGYALSLGLLVCCCFGLGLCLGLSGLALLLALDFAVFSFFPVIEDLVSEIELLVR